MRLPKLAFLPPAIVVTWLLLIAAASLVSAIERSLFEARESAAVIRIERFETECDALYRALHALSHEVSSCEPASVCEGSPLLCASALDVEIDREFERLRTALHDRCDFPLGLMDFAWSTPAGHVPSESTSKCGAAHDWLETAASGEAKVTRFIF